MDVFAQVLVLQSSRTRSVLLNFVRIVWHMLMRAHAQNLAVIFESSVFAAACSVCVLTVCPLRRVQCSSVTQVIRLCFLVTRR